MTVWRVLVERSMLMEYEIPAEDSEEAEEKALQLAAIEDTCDFDNAGERVLICDVRFRGPGRET